MLARFGVPLALLALGFILQVASLTRTLNNPFDEGIAVLGAQRILEGEVPYRDFWTIYGPGQFYAIAALFKLTAPTILAERMWDLAMRAGIGAMVYVWARRLDAGVYAFAAWLVVILTLAGTGYHGFPVFPSLLFCLIGALLFLNALEGANRTAAFFWSGACIGAAALFRHDMGLYTLVAQALALGWSLRCATDGGARWQTQAWRAALPYAAGLIAIAGPAAIFLLSQVPLRDIWLDLFVYPGTVYPRVRSLPFPPAPDAIGLISGSAAPAAFGEAFSIYFPLAAAPAAIAFWAVTRSRARDGAALRDLGILLLGAMSLLFYLKGIVRVSSLHLMPSIVPAIVVFFVLVARICRVSWMAAPIAAALALLAGLAIAGPPARLAIRAAAENWEAVRPHMPEFPRGLRGALVHLCTPKPGLEPARCFEPRGADPPVAQFIQEHTRPGERILSGTSRHDRVFVNNIMFHFLTGRPAATRWHEYAPGLHTTEPIQRQMMAELETQKVRYLVLTAEWSNVDEPNDSAVSSGVTLLDDYIREHYREAARFGAVAVWERR